MNLLINFIIILVIVFIFNYIGIRITSDKKHINYTVLIALTLIESLIFFLLLTYVF